MVETGDRFQEVGFAVPILGSDARLSAPMNHDKHPIGADQQVAKHVLAGTNRTPAQQEQEMRHMGLSPAEPTDDPVEESEAEAEPAEPTDEPVEESEAEAEPAEPTDDPVEE